MRPLLDPHIDSEPWGQGLLEADAHAETDHRGERAVGYGWGDEDGALG